MLILRRIEGAVACSCIKTIGHIINALRNCWSFCLPPFPVYIKEYLIKQISEWSYLSDIKTLKRICRHLQTFHGAAKCFQCLVAHFFLILRRNIDQYYPVFDVFPSVAHACYLVGRCQLTFAVQKYGNKLFVLRRPVFIYRDLVVSVLHQRHSTSSATETTILFIYTCLI